MKKVLSLITSLFLILFIVGCGSKTTTKNLEEEKVNYTNQIDTVVDLSIFDDKNVAIINGYVASAKQDIQNATSASQVEDIYNEFYKKYYAIKDKTYSQTLASAVQYFKEYKKNNLINFNLKRQEEISNYITQVQKDMAKVTRTKEVNELLEKAINYFNGLPTLNTEHSLGINGDFIQPGHVAYYSVDQFKEVFTTMKTVGINEVLIQWTYDTTPGNSVLYYDSDIFTADYSYPDMLDNLLNAAHSLDMKVFVGLNLTDAWWDSANTINKEWLTEQGNIGAAQAEEIYNKYYAKYPGTVYAWYFAIEYYCMSKSSVASQLGYTSQEDYDRLNKQWADLMNIYLDKFNEIDPSMPMLFSPYYSGWLGGTQQETYDQWSYFVKNTRFRKGDILAPQDGFGGGSVGPNKDEYNKAKAYLTGMYEASKDNENLEFWVNIETFAADYKPESLERVKEQIELAKTMTDHLICFSYFHYYLPEVAGTSQYHNDYTNLLKDLYK